MGGEHHNQFYTSYDWVKQSLFARSSFEMRLLLTGGREDTENKQTIIIKTNLPRPI